MTACLSGRESRCMDGGVGEWFKNWRSRHTRQRDGRRSPNSGSNRPLQLGAAAPARMRNPMDPSAQIRALNFFPSTAPSKRIKNPFRRAQGCPPGGGWEIPFWSGCLFHSGRSLESGADLLRPVQGVKFLAADVIGFACSGLAIPHRHSCAQRARGVFDSQKEIRGIAKLDPFFERTRKLASRRLKRGIERRGMLGELR